MNPSSQEANEDEPLHPETRLRTGSPMPDEEDSATHDRPRRRVETRLQTRKRLLLGLRRRGEKGSWLLMSLSVRDEAVLVCRRLDCWLTYTNLECDLQATSEEAGLEADNEFPFKNPLLITRISTYRGLPRGPPLLDIRHTS